jgi:hypothetical protein
VPEGFRPHLTLSYNRQLLAVRAIEPIAFVVKEFACPQQAVAEEYRILS